MRNTFWNTFIYPLTNKANLTKKLIGYSIDSLWNKKLNKLGPQYHIIILFRIICSDDSVKTIGSVQYINIESKNEYKDKIISLLDILENNYLDIDIKAISFSYGVKKGTVEPKVIPKGSDEIIPFTNYKNCNLPITMDINKYGILVYELDNVYVVNSKDLTIKITKIILEDSIKHIVSIYKNNNIILNYNDIFKNDDNIMMRSIDNRIYYYDSDGNLLLVSYKYKNQFIQPLSKEKQYKSLFITLDVETQVINNIHKPYLVSIYDGMNFYSFHLLDYNLNIRDMFIAVINKLNNPIYDGYTIYIHNGAKFDMIFLLRELALLGTIEPIINNSKLISVKFITSKVTITFLDSYQMLLSSLEKLGKAFDVTPKGNFPFDLTNDLPLDYIGVSPLDKSINNWNFKEESIKYCENDCLTLFEIMKKFSKIIYDGYQINITNVPTISSLAFKIYRMHFLSNFKIPILYSKLYNNLKDGYTGGSTDMFIPEGKNLFCYDVNSLYPYVMKTKEVPTGNIIKFTANAEKQEFILNHLKDKLGFYNVTVIAPENIVNPIIQIHFDNRCISPVGKFNTLLFSEEMYNAMKYGYKFIIHNGFYFENKEIIFDKYVDHFYSLRKQYDKSNPLNFIAKILLNSLYGRFGMKTDLLSHILINENQLIEMLDNSLDYDINDILKLDTNYIISVAKENNSVFNSNNNISIASAITAYSRIEMTRYKNNPFIKLYYTDTDSIFTSLSSEEINLIIPNIIGNDIGQLKEELFFSGFEPECAL